MAAPPITERHLPHFHRRAPVLESVRVATTADITISTALNNGDTLDGVTLATGDRVLVKDQSTGSENGIYVVGATPARAYDLSTDDPNYGFLVVVRQGTTNAATLWLNTNTTAPTVGSTSITFDEVTAGGGGGGGTSMPWFVVTDAAYGAVGDGSNDDTAEINLAIAALNSAGRGVLYFPAGKYKTTGALTTITAGGMALGDGMSSYDDAQYGSEILCTSQTAVLFTVSSKAFRFEGLGFTNTFAGVPSAGSAVLVDSGYLEQRVDYEGCTFQGFYDNVDVKVGAQWSMRGCFLIAPVRYGIRIRNTVNGDAGDWSISDTNISAQTHNSTSAIRVESSGGGKIVNVKINMALDSKHFTTGIDLSAGSGVATSVMTIAACSIENVTGDAIKVATTGTGQYHLIAITALQCALYSNNTGYVVNVSANTAGGYVNGGIADIVLTGIVARTDGTARPMISLTNCDGVTLGDLQYSGFNARYTSSGATNITDGSPEPIATAHLADASDAHDASAISIVDAGGYYTGTDVEAALQEIGAGGIGGGSGYHYEILMASGSADPLLTSDGLDYLYVLVPD